MEWIWQCLASSLPTTPAPSILTNPFPNPEWSGLFLLRWKTLGFICGLPPKSKCLILGTRCSVKKTLSPFFYTPKDLSKYLNDEFKESPTFNVTFDYDANTGIVTLKNPYSFKLRFSQSFDDFLGTPPILDKKFSITSLKARSAMYVHCDLVDPQSNSLNGGKSNLLVLLHRFAPHFPLWPTIRQTKLISGMFHRAKR